MHNLLMVEEVSELPPIEFWAEQARGNTSLWKQLVAESKLCSHGARRRVESATLFNRDNHPDDRQDGHQMELVGAGLKHTFTVNRDAHTIVIDVKKREREAIAEFINLVIQSASTPMLSKDELLGAALGYMGVTLANLRPELNDIYELNDATLAAMVRWTHRRDQKEKQ